MQDRILLNVLSPEPSHIHLPTIKRIRETSGNLVNLRILSEIAMRTLLNPKNKDEIERRLGDPVLKPAPLGQDVRSSNGLPPERWVQDVPWRKGCRSRSGGSSPLGG